MLTNIIQQTYKFVKEPTGRWYIDLPDYPGPHAELEMVEGADKMLDYVGEGNKEVSLLLSEKEFDGATKLYLIENLKNSIGGGYYRLDSYKGVQLDQDMWLCEVTQWVFGKLPDSIWFKRV